MMKSMKKRLVKIVKRALKRDPNLKRLEKAMQKLDKVSADVTTFLYLLESAKQEQKEQEVDFYRARETGSLPTTNYLIGRGKDKESVVQWLRNPSNKPRTSRYRNISLLSIVGHGGMGKTTLLQHVYEDEMTKEFFDLKMWVCVSNNFDVKKVIADMLESLDNKKPDLDSLEALQGRLKNEVKSRRFLLVLDDVWEEEKERDKSKWGNVLAPLAYGGFGSKILVTTRTDSIALMFEEVILEKTEPLRLKGLEDKECLELLNTHAFAVDYLDDQRKLKLKLITAEIVKKLSGSPLAAKVIGGILNSNLDEGHWRRVLNSGLEIIRLGQNDIMPVLRLSYVYLPQHLKICFTLCSIFPQDYEFDRDALVRQWIALGFIQPSHIQGEILEDIGGRYFDVLVKRNFFDKFKDYYYKMHDLMHELAQSLSIHECLRVEDGTKLPSPIPKTLRHLSVQAENPDIIKKIVQFKYLHSLFLFYEPSNQDICALSEIFKLRSLRLLNIESPEDLKIIPEEIGNLIHLRYLEIDCYNLTMLPRSVSNLYHLQYIIYDGPEKGADFLPSDINNLSNLRYVKLPENCISSICGIRKLKFLQKVKIFDLRDASGYRIGELENMDDLCKLGINCLENVKDAEEACSAKLCAKRRLIDLTLGWENTDSRNIDLFENVLDNLEPPNCLRNLKMDSYMGARSAIWMNNVNLISNLEKINLTNCSNWETLPPFGQLPFLKSLTLWNMPKVKRLQSKYNGNDKYRTFPLLEVLNIHELEALEDWFEAGVAAEDGCLFPCLIQLSINSCPKLKELPSLPSKLKSLQIRYTGWKTLNFCSISNSIPLETLEVLHCPNITSLPLADEIARLAALRDLRISSPNLRSLGNYPEVETSNNCHLMLSYLSISDPLVLLMEPLRSIASLKRLYIMYNDELVSFPNEAEQWFLNVSSSLCELEFYQLKSLESLPSSLESLSSLQKLSITKCPNLISRGSYREEETSNNCHPMLSYLGISDPSVLLMEPLRSITSLKELRIEHNNEVVSFPNEAEQWFLNVRSSLSELRFSSLKSLESLPSFLESLSSLQILSIYDVPMLRELPNLPPSLKSLTLWDVPMLRELPNLPSSLERLAIWGELHRELKERYREDGGSDRHKIAHIPEIYIST
ncbi:disease resistance protein RGA2-like [Dendrobium catenatum]|nr:disease resistance protein RGA2-like [Dendrobium catenatum]